MNMVDNAAGVPFLSTDTEAPLAGVSDFRGRPVYRRSSGGWRSALFVGAVEVAGSFAIYGVSANLITYLTGPLGHSNAAAAAAANAWSGTARLAPLVGAAVADSWLGRYRSIVLACALYVLVLVYSSKTNHELELASAMNMVDNAAGVPFLSTDTEAPLAGVSDFRGRPVYRRSSGGWRSALFVGAVEVAGSFAFYGVSANLITYLTGPLGHSNAAAAAAVNAWSGTASLMPLLGAFVADSFLGRYRSVVAACTLYTLGYGMLTLAASTLTAPPGESGSPSWPQVAFFYVSLYLVAVAQGSDKPCGLALAADQFDPEHPKERASRSSLFNWWYFSMAIGISVAVSIVSYVQENVGWGFGFGAPWAIMLCAFAAFLLGTPTYRLYAPGPGAESPFARLVRSLAALARRSSYSLGRASQQQQYEQEEEDVKMEEARGVLRLLPIWATCLAYGVVFAQIMTLFNKQGRTLDRCVAAFGLELELPPAALQTFGPLTILVFVPIYDRALVPALRRATGNPSGLTLLQRVGTGMAVSLAAVSLAAAVEARRLETAREHGLVDEPGATVPMSWAWLVPQYVMTGVADVFAVVGLQELFYDQMPTELRSLGLALYLSVMGIGGFISSALISLIDRVTGGGGGDSWFADNLNRAHLDYFYWLLAGLSAAELALYFCFARSYVYNHRKSLL